MISFEQMMRRLRGHHKGKDFSTLTLLAIFDTEDPSIINAIPREEFIARVNEKKQKLRLPVPRPSKSGGGEIGRWPKDKLMGLTTGQAVGAVKHALRQCNKRSVKGGHMDAATYHSSFVPHFMAHFGLTDVKKVPSQNTLQTIYIAHKGDGRRGRPTAPPPPRSKRARKAPKKMED